MKLTIDKTEVLRYLGWKGQDYSKSLDSLVEKMMADCLACAIPKSVVRAFSVAPIQEGIAVAGTPLVLTGNAIASHLQGAQKVCLLAATLGPAVDNTLRRLSYTDVTASVIFDAAATALIEAYCDQIESEAKAESIAEGFSGNFRFSPGYGDLPLELQPVLLRVLQAEKALGLTCSPSLMLTPSKSVTAVWGLFSSAQPCPDGGHAKCAGCSLSATCRFRR